MSWQVVTGKTGVVWSYIDGMENGKARLNLIPNLSTSLSLSSSTIRSINLGKDRHYRSSLPCYLSSFLEPVSLVSEFSIIWHPSRFKRGLKLAIWHPPGIKLPWKKL